MNNSFKKIIMVKFVQDYNRELAAQRAQPPARDSAQRTETREGIVNSCTVKSFGLRFRRSPGRCCRRIFRYIYIVYIDIVPGHFRSADR